MNNNNKRIDRTKIRDFPTGVKHHISQFLDTSLRAATRFTNKEDRFPLTRHYELALKQELKQETSYNIREKLAQNPKLYQMPETIITTITNKSNQQVRRNLASNPNLYQMPEEVITTLLNDNESVRSHLSENPNLYKIPQEIFVSDHEIDKLHIVRDIQKINNMLDTDYIDNATTLLNSLMHVNGTNLDGISREGYAIRKILSNIVKKSINLYKLTNNNQELNPLYTMFNLLKDGILLEYEADDAEEEPDAPFSLHLKEIVEHSLENTVHGNGKLGKELLLLARKSKTDTQLAYLLKGNEIFRGKDKIMFYKLLANQEKSPNKENITNMLKEMLPLYDAGHFADGSTFGVLLPKIVDFIKKNPSKIGFWNVSDLPECDFKTIYKKSYGNLAEMKNNFNLSQPKQSVDKLSNLSSTE